MGHIHPVTDSDTHFVIDPITRQLKNETCKKLTLMQGDHNSERFTFELPRYIEGHDMSTCNRVEVHYINIKAETKERSEGVYEVDDFGISPDNEAKCRCSWLISANATKYSGFLNFVVRFTCGDGETVDYVWNTAIYSGVSISDGVYNGDVVVTEYADILAQWWKKLLLANGGSIDENSGEQIKIWVGTMAEYEALGGETIENCLYIITDGNAGAGTQLYRHEIRFEDNNYWSVYIMLITTRSEAYTAETFGDNFMPHEVISLTDGTVSYNFGGEYISGNAISFVNNNITYTQEMDGLEYKLGKYSIIPSNITTLTDTVEPI